ncbi:hypothetical protein C7E12_21010, partial [Stenotrophomonas maltophilia]
FCPRWIDQQGVAGQQAVPGQALAAQCAIASVDVTSCAWPAADLPGQRIQVGIGDLLPAVD